MTTTQYWRRRLLSCCDPLTDEDANPTAAHASVKLVGVWDRKFIVLSVPPHPSRDDPSPLLLICDFHALHERLRLEYLIAKLPAWIHSVMLPLSIPLELTATASDAHRHRKALQQLGWVLSFQDNDAVLEGPPAARVVAVPLLQVEGFEYYFPDVSTLMQTMQELNQCGNSSGEDVMVVVPSAFLEALVSRSCRGALMVGDALSERDAVQLVVTAAKCVTQFHVCSHGRPSFALMNVTI